MHMQDPAAYIVVFSFLAFCILALGFFLYTRIHNRFSPKVTVKAQVVDQHGLTAFSKYSGNGKAYRNVVAFEAKGRKLSFHVSEFSYNGCRVGERGQLTCKGNRLIDFH